MLPRARMLLALLLLVGCAKEGRDDGRPPLGVTTSYIECAVLDLAGDQFRIVRMLPPGSCPGHFDVTPAMVADLRACRLLLRFDFQTGLDGRLARLRDRGMSIVPIPAAEGLCIPATYLGTCRAVHGALCDAYPEHGSRYAERLAAIGKRMDDLTASARARVEGAGLRRASVVASGHQTAFCKALGLDVVAAYTGGESLARLEACIARGEEAGVRFVVATLQEGPQLAEPLAHRLKAKAVVFSNFPSMAEGQTTFDDLVKANVAGLVAAGGAP